MLLKLATMFDIDYLLPRSFMAVLQLDKLESVVGDHLIPPEVVLAGIYYFVIKDVIPKADNTLKVQRFTLFPIKNEYPSVFFPSVCLCLLVPHLLLFLLTNHILRRGVQATNNGNNNNTIFQYLPSKLIVCPCISLHSLFRKCLHLTKLTNGNA